MDQRRIHRPLHRRRRTVEAQGRVAVVGQLGEGAEERRVDACRIPARVQRAVEDALRRFKDKRPCVASEDRRDLVAGVLRVHVEAVHRPIRRHCGRDLHRQGVGRRLRSRVTRVARAAVAATNAAIVVHVAEAIACALWNAVATADATLVRQHTRPVVQGSVRVVVACAGVGAPFVQRLDGNL